MLATQWSPKISIAKLTVSLQHKPIFIADIGANHDGDLGRATDLIYLAAEAGADVAKFQHFSAQTIVSDFGFKNLDPKHLSHQKNWSKTVYEIYKDASIDNAWNESLRDACREAGIVFMTSPYSKKLVDIVDPLVPAHKIGSGDITWIDLIQHVANKDKPYMLACGASNLDDVQRAVNACTAVNPNIVLMQCNTNYTGSLENFKYVNLNVLRNFAELYPSMLLGLSDHTPGHSTVLGAIALGARVIEKHFTDDKSRTGPDHSFAMNPSDWREMVDRGNELFFALGDGVKKIERNEEETAVLQRRCVRTSRAMGEGEVITENDLAVLRPCPAGAISPTDMSTIVGQKLTKSLRDGEEILWSDLAK